MTVLDKTTVGGVDGRTLRRYLAVAVLAAAVGAGATLGVSQFTDRSTGAIYEGPAVERSVAMNDNLGVLTKSAYAQMAGALRSNGQIFGEAYEGPAVERSIAMNENIDALMKSAYAQQAGGSED